MPPLRLIKGTILHIFGPYSLLVWNLLFCFIYASCYNQKKQDRSETISQNQTRDLKTKKDDTTEENSKKQTNDQPKATKPKSILKKKHDCQPQETKKKVRFAQD